MGKNWNTFERDADQAGALAALTAHLDKSLYRLDESQNFVDEVCNSVLNQSSDLVTAFAVMRKINPGCFHASMAVLGTNALARLVIGLVTACSGEVEVESYCKVVTGLVWGMIEPVSGNAILASGVRFPSYCSWGGGLSCV